MAAAAPHAPRRAPAAEPSAGGRAPAPLAVRGLLPALAACLLLAAFSGGATDLPGESWVQLALAVLAAAACCAWLYGGGIALRAPRAAWAGLGLLTAFALWSGLSIAWSVAPDRSWAELNRGLAYVLAALLGIAAGTSLARASARACATLTFAGVLIALFALAGKTVPGVSLGGLLDLDQAGEVSRLRAPFGYWNALGLACALAAPPAVAVALDRRRGAAGRTAALLGLAVLLVVLALTYSRGALVALLCGLGLVLAVGGARLRVLAVSLA
ncbi:MAG TPA: hypothetical protein VF533_11000, partial [Solirubrobacteraceae bacterium]